MEFDRNAPGKGIEVDCTLENGKAMLTFRFCIRDLNEKALLSVTVTDAEGAVVLECLRREPEEEPLQAILLQPKLWEPQNPYLYRLEARLLQENGEMSDQISRSLPLRSIRRSWKTELLLNEQIFSPKAVNYKLPHGHSKPEIQNRIHRDLKMLCELGADTLSCDARERQVLMPVCDKLGLLVWTETAQLTFRGGKSPLVDAFDRPTELFYRYKANWSSKPFVYIVPGSVKMMENGNYTATVYSNCGRVALYSDGVLFEFSSGETEFVFRDIPARHPCVMLTAEAEGCRMSFSIHKGVDISY